MITIDENKLETMINVAVNKQLSSDTFKFARETIKDTIKNVIIGEFYQEIRNNVAELMKNLYDERIDEKFNSVIRKRFPPSIIYVNESRDIPPQLIPLGVNEIFAPPNGPCIYFLCKEDRIVYIGQSIYLGSRLSEHITNKNFDRVFYMNVKKEDLSRVESELIEYYEPEYNGRPFMKYNHSGHERQRR